MNAASGIASQAQFDASAPKAIASKAGTLEKAKETAKKFESMFITQMLNHMFEGVNADKGPFSGGQGESMFRPMLMDEYGKMIANRGGFGLSDKITRQLMASQEVKS